MRPVRLHGGVVSAKTTHTAMIESGKIAVTTTSTTTETATIEQLKNALWLRRTPAAMLASALHGGHAAGFAIAMSDLKTSEIEAAYIAADPAGAAKAKAEYEAFLAEARASR